MSGKAPGRFRRVLLHWTALTTVIFWLPLVRSLFDGSSYRWQLFRYSGEGVGGDLWFLLLGTGFAVWMLYLGWRGARPPFHFLLVGWHALITAALIWVVVRAAESLVLRGDTLGLEVPLGLAGPFVLGGFAIASAVWVAQDFLSGRKPYQPSWTLRELRILGVFAAALPVQFVLLRFGPPDGTTDQIGVILTLAQWLLIGLALQPRPAAGRRTG